MIIQRLDEIQVMSQRGDEIFKGLDGLSQHSQTVAYLAGRQSIFQGGSFRLEIAAQGAEFCRRTIRHFIHIEAGGIRIIQDVQQDMNLSIHGVRKMHVHDWVGKVHFVVQPHLHIGGSVRKTELKEIVSGRGCQRREVVFFQQGLGNVTGVDGPLLRLGQLIDPADG